MWLNQFHKMWPDPIQCIKIMTWPNNHLIVSILWLCFGGYIIYIECKPHIHNPHVIITTTSLSASKKDLTNLLYLHGVIYKYPLYFLNSIVTTFHPKSRPNNISFIFHLYLCITFRLYSLYNESMVWKLDHGLPIMNQHNLIMLWICIYSRLVSSMLVISRLLLE